MTIEVISIADCPNHQPAVAAVNAVLQAESLLVPVIERILNNADEAPPRFAGSPTVLVDGVDVDPTAKACASLACRIYENGSGVPSVQSLRLAITRALYDGRSAE